MIRNILKIIITLIAALVVGFLLGFLCGVILGLAFGLGLSLFFREIVFAHQTILMSILLSSILGGLLGWFAIQIINRFAETNDKAWAGIAAGVVVGVIVAVWLYGYIDIPDPSVFEQSFYTVPIFYSVSIGGQTGTIIFSIFGVAAVIRDAIRNHQEIRKNAKLKEESKNELSFYRSKNSVDDV
jgi:hypothetical protein